MINYNILQLQIWLDEYFLVFIFFPFFLSFPPEDSKYARLNDYMANLHLFTGLFYCIGKEREMCQKYQLRLTLKTGNLEKNGSWRSVVSFDQQCSLFPRFRDRDVVVYSIFHPILQFNIAIQYCDSMGFACRKKRLFPDPLFQRSVRESALFREISFSGAEKQLLHCSRSAAPRSPVAWLGNRRHNARRSFAPVPNRAKALLFVEICCPNRDAPIVFPPRCEIKIRAAPPPSYSGRRCAVYVPALVYSLLAACFARRHCAANRTGNNVWQMPRWLASKQAVDRSMGHTPLGGMSSAWWGSWRQKEKNESEWVVPLLISYTLYQDTARPCLFTLFVPVQIWPRYNKNTRECTISTEFHIHPSLGKVQHAISIIK